MRNYDNIDLFFIAVITAYFVTLGCIILSFIIIGIKSIFNKNKQTIPSIEPIKTKPITKLEKVKEKPKKTKEVKVKKPKEHIINPKYKEAFISIIHKLFMKKKPSIVSDKKLEEIVPVTKVETDIKVEEESKSSLELAIAKIDEGPKQESKKETATSKEKISKDNQATQTKESGDKEQKQVSKEAEKKGNTTSKKKQTSTNRNNKKQTTNKTGNNNKSKNTKKSSTKKKTNKKKKANNSKKSTSNKKKTTKKKTVKRKKS